MDFPKYETVKVEREGNGVTWVILNRPEKMNAMNPTLNQEMLSVLNVIETDEETRVMVLTGAGRAYCAGQDIKETFRERDADRDAHKLPTLGQDWRFDKLYYLPKPTIAMVNGWTCGGAFTHLFACDFAVASEDAKLCLSEVNWGIIAGGLVTKVISAELRYRDALEALLLAEPYSGTRAAEIGFVNYAVPAAELRSATLALADKIMTKSLPVYVAQKLAYRAVLGMDWASAKTYLASEGERLRISDPSRASGMREFLDNKSYKPGLGAFPKS
ncbi:MAG TPA: p-hydroxycinnamoyl CoA hydratase/lyase [Acidimicrobiales bacterium]|nr:p-hydroxycinnamoyl CoA hydratase/lyase [Acidimicrobiales bacterium]